MICYANSQQSDLELRQTMYIAFTSVNDRIFIDKMCRVQAVYVASLTFYQTDYFILCLLKRVWIFLRTYSLILPEMCICCANILHVNRLNVFIPLNWCVLHISLIFHKCWSLIFVGINFGELSKFKVLKNITSVDNESISKIVDK